jgi:hypothetical protein
MREDLVEDGSRFDHVRPANEHGNAIGPFPVLRLFAPEGSAAAVRPGHHLSTVVGGVDDDGVVGDAEVVEFFQQLADVGVVLDHAVGFNAIAGFALGFGLEVGEDVHAGGVVVAEEGLSGLSGLVHPIERGVGEFVIDGLHALDSEWAGVFDSLPADFAECGIDRRVVFVRGPTVHDAAWAELRLEFGVLGVVRVFGFFFGVEVIEIAEELVEAVDAGEEVVAVAEMIFWPNWPVA